MSQEILEPKLGWFTSWLPFLRWSPTTPQLLKDAEESILAYVKTPSRGLYVNIGRVPGTGEDCYIWTQKFSSNSPKPKVPLVMIHGMGAGLAMFALNFTSLSRERDVYAIDLPGFGRSSRITFPSKPHEVEEQYVNCIDRWREEMRLNKIVLLGHSFGGYLTALYSIKHPQSLHQAILADPWGMRDRPKDLATRSNIPMWRKALGSILTKFNPLFALRAAGPAGPWLVARMRPTLYEKYQDLMGEGKQRLISDYLFHCNGHSPTGEAAFHRLMSGFGWAKNPIQNRLVDLDKNVKLTVLYGSNSWMTPVSQEDLDKLGLQTQVRVLSDAGHHIYADQYQSFNDAVNDAIL